MKSKIKNQLCKIILSAAIVLAAAPFVAACGHTHDYSARKELISSATCEEDGVVRNYCSCGEYKDARLEHTGHNFGEWEVQKPATSSESGLEVRKCKNEGCDKEETREIPKLQGGQEEETDGTFTLAVNVLRTSGEAFPASRGLKIEVQDNSGTVVKSSYRTVEQFKLSPGNYNVVIKNVPEGFTLSQTVYPVTQDTKELNITLPAVPMSGEITNSTVYREGGLVCAQTLDVIGLTPEEDTQTSIPKLLETYKAVLINIYFKTCPACLVELDYLVDAYNATAPSGKKYGEEVAMIMLGRSDSETKDSIRAFKADPNTYMSDYNVKARNLPLMMVYSPVTEMAFRRNSAVFQGWPTTVVIDAEGVITYMQTATAPSPSHFTNQMDRAISAYDKIQAAKAENAAKNSVNALPEAMLPVSQEEKQRKSA